MSGLGKSHFELLGLDERFSIDPNQLQDAYRKVQGAVHPDRFAHADESQRRVAMQWAAAANEAFTTLRDPVRRAAYLCQRRGTSIDAERNTAMPADFLVKQMQWREALEEAREASDQDAIGHLRQELNGFREAAIAELADSLDVTGDAARAAALTRELMFLDKFGREIDAAVAHLD